MPDLMQICMHVAQYLQNWCTRSGTLLSLFRKYGCRKTHLHTNAIVKPEYTVKWYELN